MFSLTLSSRSLTSPDGEELATAIIRSSVSKATWVLSRHVMGVAFVLIIRNCEISYKGLVYVDVFHFIIFCLTNHEWRYVSLLPSL